MVGWLTKPSATAPASDDWTLEESLDVDMVSAICPLCKIDLVEATNDTGTGLYVAEETAATTLGAHYISNSWGGSESSTDLTYDSEYFGVSGVVYTASAGDSAYSGGVIYPATSPHVVSVGAPRWTPRRTRAAGPRASGRPAPPRAPDLAALPTSRSRPGRRPSP